MKDTDPPTAILFNNDALALGGCRALRDLRLQPGRDVAVIVIVDRPLCGYLSPALTGFSVRLEPLVRRLAEMLLAAMPRYAGTDGPRILREVWPLALTAPRRGERIVEHLERAGFVVMKCSNVASKSSTHGSRCAHLIRPSMLSLADMAAAPDGRALDLRDRESCAAEHGIP